MGAEGADRRKERAEFPREERMEKRTRLHRSGKNSQAENGGVLIVKAKITASAMVKNHCSSSLHRWGHFKKGGLRVCQPLESRHINLPNRREGRGSTDAQETGLLGGKKKEKSMLKKGKR